jgi:putative membrane protein
MLQPVLQKNDKKATLLIIVFSAIVFTAVTVLSKIKLNVDLGFNKHLFAEANALINSLVSVLLIAGLWAVRNRKLVLHKNIMLMAMALSVLFLLSYICHHLFTGETKFGDTDHNGVLSDEEKMAAGSLRYVYYFIISTHIILAGIIMPFVLFTAYRALIAEWPQHKKLAKLTWPIWFYVAVTGVVVYFMISPYY